MGGFAAMPLLQLHVFKSTRMHHFEGQIAEDIVAERLCLPGQFTHFFSCFFLSSFSSLNVRDAVVSGSRRTFGESVEHNILFPVFLVCICILYKIIPSQQNVYVVVLLVYFIIYLFW